MSASEKPLVWVGRSYDDLLDMTAEVQDNIGYALGFVQNGVTPKNAKPMKGFKLAVYEIIANYDSDTYRAVYTVELAGVVYVLHVFEKKSKHGIATPRQEIELIRQRLREAIDIHEGE